MSMDQRVIKAALDSFEQDDFLHAKELVQGQIRQAKNDFLKGKLGLKNDLENQYVEVNAGDDIKAAKAEPTFTDPTEESEPVEEPKPRKRMLSKKKKV